MQRTLKHFAILLFLLLKIISTNAADQAPLSGDQKRLKAIELSMDIHRLPCVDFYNYACGEWQNAFGQENLQVLNYQLEKEMEKIVNSFVKISEPKFLATVYKYFLSCEELKGEEDSLEFLKWLHQHENVTWSIISPKDEQVDDSIPDWMQLLAIMRKYGFNELLLYSDIVQRRDDPLKLIVELRRPALIGLNDFSQQMQGLEDKMDVVVKQKFRQFQKDILKLTVDLIKTEENDDIEFLLNSISKPSDMVPQLMTLKDLKMPWLNRYLRVLLEPQNLDDNMQIYVHSVKYLNTIYEFFSKQDNRFLSEYIQWKFLKFLMDSDLSRQRASCLQSTRHLFPMVMQWVYEKNHFELQWETETIRSLFDNLKKQSKLSLADNIYEFSTDIQLYLQDKIDKLQLLMGHVSANDLEHYYADLYLEPLDYYGNFLKVLNFNFQMRLESLSLQRLTPNALELLDLRSFKTNGNIAHTLALSNLPQLYPQLNIIYFPQTLLRSPYYEYDMSDLYSYSSIGFLLAHEIAKAFNQRYLFVDANGIYNSLMFKQIQKNRKFQQFIQHLQRDLEEDVIDDLIGLKLTYDTLAHEHLDDLKNATVVTATTVMNREEIFFLNFAQNFCGTVCSQPIKGYFLCDRVSKPLRYFDKFAQTFRCDFKSIEQETKWV